MASLARQMMSRFCVVSRTFQSIKATTKRHLFSSEILGVENFKRIRIFEKDKLVNREDFIKQLYATSQENCIQSKRIVHDLMKLIYVAEKESDVSLITDLLMMLYCTGPDDPECSAMSVPTTEMPSVDGPLSPKWFQFGPLVFRLLYVLKDTATAQALFDDQSLKALFRSTTCHLLLTDMLYEAGCFQQVVDTFSMLQHSGVSAKFTPDCTTLAMAALYQLNNAESYREMTRLMEEAKAEGSALSRRSLLFAAALALRQREAVCALNIVQPLVRSSETLFRNIKVMALAQLGHLEEVLMTVEESMNSDSPESSRAGILYSDTVREVRSQFEAACDPELTGRLEAVLSTLEADGLLSPQTVQHFVNRLILRQRTNRSSHSFKTRVKSPLKMKLK